MTTQDLPAPELQVRNQGFIDFMVAHFKGAPPWDDWLKDYPDHAVAKQS